MDPELVCLVRNLEETGWATVARLCMDVELQDKGVDLRLAAWPLEFKYQGGTWWEWDHLDNRQWRRTST